MYILYCRYLCVCWLLLVPMNMQTCWACITIGLNGWSIVNEVWIIFNSIPIATLNNEMGSYGLSLVWLYWVAYSGEGKMCLCCVFFSLYVVTTWFITSSLLYSQWSQDKWSDVVSSFTLHGTCYRACTKVDCSITLHGLYCLQMTVMKVLKVASRKVQVPRILWCSEIAFWMPYKRVFLARFCAFHWSIEYTQGSRVPKLYHIVYRVCAFSLVLAGLWLVIVSSLAEKKKVSCSLIS